MIDWNRNALRSIWSSAEHRKHICLLPLS